MKDVLIRIATGVLFIGVVIGCISWNQYSTAALFFVFSMIGTFEFYRILEKNELSHNLRYGLITNAWIYGVLTLVFIGELDFHLISLCIPMVIILVLLELFSDDNIPYQNISSTLFATFYITLPFACLNYLSFNKEIYDTIGLDQGWSLLAGYFIILWTNDSMAYVSGRLLGRTKLFERVSPKKTWEGFIGGVVFAVLAAYLFALFTGVDNEHIYKWIVMSVIIGVLGTLGDLSESLLKRSGDVKDSGSILPGHGGVLDRFDGILLSAPLVLVYLLYIG